MSRLMTAVAMAVVAFLALVPGAVAPAADMNASGQVAEVSGPLVVDQGETITGDVAFSRVAAKHAISIRWVDTKGRLCGKIETTVEPPKTTLAYQFPLAGAVGYNHRIEVLVDGKLAPVSLSFTVRRSYQPWLDYNACVWARYTAGEADLVRQAGFTGSINAGRNVTDADMAFYCDNIVYEVFAYYHKRPVEFQGMKQLWMANPNNRTLAHRRPSLTDEGTWEVVRDRLLPVVAKAAPFRPIFYNVADEIGIGDQSAVTDLDWEYSSRTAWRDWLQARYQTLEAVNRQWGTTFDSWQAIRSFFPGTNFMYDQLWSSNLLPKSFATVDKFNEAMGVKYDSFGAVVAGYCNVRSDDKGMTAAGLKERYAKIDALNKDLGATFADFAAAAAYLAKFEQWVGRQTPADTRGWNLSWWCDWREYMDDYMANGLGRACEMGRKADPGGRFGITGTHHPGVFSGHNYGKLVEKIDCIIPYNIGQSFELIHGLKPDLPYMNATWDTGDKLRRDLWYNFLHGSRGVLAWDNQEPTNKVIDRATGALTERGKASGPTLREITSGLDRLVIQSKREHSGVAIYESQMSARVNWFHQFIGLGRQYMRRGSADEFKTDERSVLRTSWIKLIEDNHLQHLFVTPEQVAAGRLGTEGVKVLILPETWCIGDDEAKNIEAFVRAGGMVIADQYTGLYDGHGRRRAAGALDGLFGIDQSGVTGDLREPLIEPTTRPVAKDVVAPSPTTEPVERTIEAATARARLVFWRALCTRGSAVAPVKVVDGNAVIGAGDAANAANVTRTVGQGKAAFLNLDVSHYNYARVDDLPRAEQVLAVVRAALPDTVQPTARIVNAASGKRQMGTEVGTWSAGPGRKTLAVWRNYNVNIEGIGGPTYSDNALFQKAEKVRIQLPAKQHVINQRTGQDLGQTDAVELELLPWEPLILSVSDKPFAAFTVTGPDKAKCGQSVALTIAGEPLANTLQVFRVEAVNPAGAAVWYYTKTVSGFDGKCAYDIRLALNDWPGAWTFKVRDVATGKTVEHKVQVSE